MNFGKESEDEEEGQVSPTLVGLDNEKEVENQVDPGVNPENKAGDEDRARPLTAATDDEIESEGHDDSAMDLQNDAEGKDLNESSPTDSNSKTEVGYQDGSAPASVQEETADADQGVSCSRQSRGRD